MVKYEKVKKFKRRIPFYKEIIDTSVCKPTSRIKIRNRLENNEAKVIDNKLTQKNLTEAQRQLDDIEEEVGVGRLCKDLQTSHLYAGLPKETDGKVYYEKENCYNENFIKETECNGNSVSDDLLKKATFVDILREKFTEKRTEVNTIFSDAGTIVEDNPELLSIFKNLAIVLSHYCSGKLPKHFKAIPRFAAWEQLLSLTEPDKWTSAAMFQATRLFSSMKSEMAQRFYNLILLPRLRDEIAQCKKLNNFLYRAVQKALYKHKAFFKGIILPLCETGCTQKEATILSSILAKSSLPKDSSSVSLILISRMPFSGTNCHFMRVLLEKKCALRCKVIDEIVDYFLRFVKDDKHLPAIWHQCLLTFVQIYKNNLSQDQLQELLNLLKIQKHHKISIEIHKELLSVNCLNGEIIVDKTAE